MQLTRAWLGYDVPYSQVENYLFVQLVRKEGLRKRLQQPEHHVTVGYFDSIDTHSLAATLTDIQAPLGPLAQADISFTSYGVLESDKGSYVYLSPDITTSPLPEKLKRALEAASIYDIKNNCQDLHLSIGGADPFSREKPPQRKLPEPLEIRGRLILVGKQGEGFVRYSWSDAEKVFQPLQNGAAQETQSRQAIHPAEGTLPSTSATESKYEPPPQKPTPEPLPIHTIAIYPKIQADTATTVFLLQKYGKDRYPGIEMAKTVFWNRLPETASAEDTERRGTLLLDLGGRYDHHVTNKSEGKRNECLSTIVAKDLGIEQNPELKKILAWAKRDDLEGKGTISADALDRAFGLSGIIMNFNRLYRDRLGDALAIITEILSLHVQEEYKRTVELPQEWERLMTTGEIRSFSAQQGSAVLQCCTILSDNTAFPGFAKAAKKMDLIVQRAQTGHTNIITQQLRSLDLRPVIAALREAERAALGMPPLPRSSTATGIADEIMTWYYDDAANTIQNGGIDPQGLPATKLSLDAIITILRTNLPKGVIGSLKRDKESGMQR